MWQCDTHPLPQPLVPVSLSWPCLYCVSLSHLLVYRTRLLLADGAHACAEVFKLTLGTDASTIKLDGQKLLPRKGSVPAQESQLEVVMRGLQQPDPPNGYVMPPQTAATLAYCWKKGFYQADCDQYIIRHLYSSLRPHDDQQVCFPRKGIIVRQLAATLLACKWKPGMLLTESMQTCFTASASGEFVQRLHILSSFCAQLW